MVPTDEHAGEDLLNRLAQVGGTDPSGYGQGRDDDTHIRDAHSGSAVPQGMTRQRPPQHQEAQAE